MALSVDKTLDVSSNVVEGNGTNSLTFTMPSNVAISVESVVATIDNAVGNATTAELVIRDSSGVVVATRRQASTIPAGGSGTATFALRLVDDAAVSSSSGIGALLYDYTVTGVDKATIDTTVDGPYAGSFSGAHKLLSAHLYARTDESMAALSDVSLTFNGDTGTNYTRGSLLANAGGVSAGGITAQSALVFPINGDASGWFSVGNITIPNYAATTGQKTALLQSGAPQGVAANILENEQTFLWNSLAALTSMKFALNPGIKFRVDTRLTVFGF